jgi:hypothetical protein
MQTKDLKSYNLPNCLARRLNSTPGRDVSAFDDRSARTSELSDEALVCDNSTVEIDLWVDVFIRQGS